MQVDSVLLRLEDYTTNANSIKEIVLSRLKTDKAITPEQAKEYAEKYQVIVFKKNWFKRWMASFANGGEDEYQFKYVRFED